MDSVPCETEPLIGRCGREADPPVLLSIVFKFKKTKMQNSNYGIRLVL